MIIFFYLKSTKCYGDTVIRRACLLFFLKMFLDKPSDRAEQTTVSF